MLAHAGRLMLLAATVLFAASGCAMCSSCDDYSYPAHGGIWQRLDPVYGRVGSVFTPEVWAEGGDHVPAPREPTPSELPPPPAEPQSQESAAAWSDSDIMEPFAPMEELAPAEGFAPPEELAPNDDLAPAPDASSELPDSSVLQLPGTQVR